METALPHIFSQVEGERLYLRDFSTADWLAVHRYAADPEVVRFMSWGPNTPEETLNFVTVAAASAERQPRRRYDLAIIRKADLSLIGGCGLYIQAPRTFEAEIGYCLRRDHWGCGYATETAGLLLRLAFGPLQIHRVFATCDPHNLASARVLEKAGLRREGLMRGHMRRGGVWTDSYLYAVLAGDMEVASVAGRNNGDTSRPC